MSNLCVRMLLFIEPRGFGFVTFDNPQTLDRILEISDHYVDGKLVECKKAVPKENPCSGVLSQQQPKSQQ